MDLLYRETHSIFRTAQYKLSVFFFMADIEIECLGHYFLAGISEKETAESGLAVLWNPCLRFSFAENPHLLQHFVTKF